MLGIDTFYMTSYKSERQRKVIQNDIQNDMYNTSTITECLIYVYPSAGSK
ncbi:protein of unknown function [Candidatus Nitrosocosmicus franklandus]|uniref:Uncharacterized protein n=1 Tax=Candidatus Nitrosocosmicus franklandianus TaxID=1798806 RepID=A0A484IDD9_9ARCH|nr:protein of unknown function [Candidatus Nitrosocosmicus franklandus]